VFLSSKKSAISSTCSFVKDSEISSSLRAMKYARCPSIVLTARGAFRGNLRNGFSGLIEVVADPLRIDLGRLWRLRGDAFFVQILRLPPRSPTIHGFGNACGRETVSCRTGVFRNRVQARREGSWIPCAIRRDARPDAFFAYDRFRRGALRSIVLFKVGNFAVDLPEADVLIQVSGAFGSRQEEAQRFRRILRPKKTVETTASSRSSRAIRAKSRNLRITASSSSSNRGYSYQVAS
jgi:hypothetical protein